MKKIFLLLFCFTAIVNLTFSQEKWSRDPRITVKPPMMSNFVRAPYIPWENPNKQTSVYYTPAGVLAVGANFRVLPNSNQQDEIVLTSNPSFPLLLFGSANTTAGSAYSQGVYASTNGGVNWYGTDLMPNCPNGASDPAPAIDKNGTFVFTTLNTTGSISMIGLYSTNYGVNWSSPFIVPGGSPSDKNMIGTDDVPSSPYYGNTYTVWSKTSGTWPIMVSTTSNSGVSWSSAIQINTPSVTSQGCDVVVGPAGVVYVCWSKQSGVSSGIGFSKSTNGGVNWATTETAITVNGMRSNSFNGWGIRTNDFPRIACDKSGGPRNGWLYIVDCEKNYAPAGTDEDIVLHTSSNGGTSWSAGVRVNQDAMNNGKVQFFPCVAVDGNGGVNVLYYDNRNYPSYGDSCETYMSRSIDGGITFTDIKVSDHRWKPAPEPGLGTYAGDYIGITCGNGKIWPFWFDNKSGSMQAWTAPIDLGPSILHTPLTNTEQISGTRAVNAVITPSGSGINPSSVKLYYSKDNPVLTTFIAMTNTSGTNWTAALPLSGSGLYRYYLTATDSLLRTVTSPGGAPTNVFSFTASTDTIKPVVTTIPLPNTPKTQWPATVTATVTDNIGVDSAWVRWYKNTPSTGLKRFNLANTSGTTWSNPFNSTQADVAIGDSIFYRVIGRDISALHNMDSTPLYNFKIINLVNACVGTGTSPSNYPFTTYWDDGRTDMLFTAAEITGVGGSASYIMKVGFNVITADPAPMNGFKVKLQNTTQTTLTGFVASGWTVCYDGVYTLSGTGWQYITLQTPYFWNGTSNLLVEVCYNNAAYTSYSPVNATSMPGMTWGQYTDLPSGDGCTAFTAGTAQAIRPNICFNISPTLGAENNSLLTPIKYSLSQNYPNPFNPVTKINFDIPKQGLVNLKIYDVLGREVKVLVNEVKTPGTYSVDFNASEFASGVYFYRMESNGFIDVKKLLLVK